MSEDAGPPATPSIETRILDAARRLMLRYGYDKTTIQDIASEAGISKSALYQRWNKRDDLFAALMWRETRSYIEDWFDRVEADPDGGTFHGIFKHALLALYANPFIEALYGKERAMLGNFLARAGIGQLYARRMLLVRHFLESLQAAGVVRPDIDPKATALLTSSIQYGLIKLTQALPDTDEYNVPTEQMLATAVGMVERYVTPDTPPDSEAGKRVVRQYIALLRAELNQIENESDKGTSS